MTVALIVEGDLEEDVLLPLLRRALPELGQHRLLRPLNAQGWANLRKDLPKMVRRVVEVDGADVVFSLCDLYQGDWCFPHGCDSAEKRADYLKCYLADLVPQELRAKFRPHLAVHDIEAWLLADRDLLRKYDINPPAGDPEALDFGEQSHPKARLKELWRVAKKRGYRKVTDGVRLFGQVSVQVVAEKCRYFRELVEDLRHTFEAEGTGEE